MLLPFKKCYNESKTIFADYIGNKYNRYEWMGQSNMGLREVLSVYGCKMER